MHHTHARSAPSAHRRRQGWVALTRPAHRLGAYGQGRQHDVLHWYSTTKVSRSKGTKRHPSPIACEGSHLQPVDFFNRLYNFRHHAKLYIERGVRQQQAHRIGHKKNATFSYLKKQSFFCPLPLWARAYHVTQRDSSNGASGRWSATDYASTVMQHCCRNTSKLTASAVVPLQVEQEKCWWGMQSWDDVRCIHSEDQRWQLVLCSWEEELRVHKLCMAEHRPMNVGITALCQLQ